MVLPLHVEVIALRALLVLARPAGLVLWCLGHPCVTAELRCLAAEGARASLALMMLVLGQTFRSSRVRQCDGSDVCRGGKALSTNGRGRKEVQFIVFIVPWSDNDSQGQAEQNT
jgi:hypothetical protein